MRLKRLHTMLFLFLFAILLEGVSFRVSAQDEEAENDGVIYLTTVSDELFGSGVHLPAKVRDNLNVRKIVIPKEAEYVLADYRYEMDPYYLQNYESLTPNCPNLAAVEVDPENSHFKVVDGILYSKDLSVLYYCPPAKEGVIVLPKEVEVIQYMAFQECDQITSILLSSSLQYIYAGAFGGNTSLESIKIAEDNPNYKVKANVLYSKNGEILYLYPHGKSNSKFIIPSGVRRIHPGAFMGSENLRWVSIPKTVSSIGIEAFENCSNLTKVKLKEGLLTIEAGAFMNCSNLKELTFPDGLLNVHQDAIYGCNQLKHIRIPESIQNGPTNLNQVKDRIIHCYSLYNWSWAIHDENVDDTITAYVYEGVPAADYAIKQGDKIKYIRPNVLTLNPVTTVPKTVVKGKGKPDTSWFNAKQSTFTIKNPDQLAGLAKLVNQKNSMKGKTFFLANDLDLSCYPNWEPIGMITDEEYNVFKGTLDGNGHTIYNLRMNRIDLCDMGLFGLVEGAITNLNIVDADILGGSGIGILCGFMNGKVSNCLVSGRVRGNETVGGMIGNNSGVVTGCSVDVVVRGVKVSGGILGRNSGTLSDSTSKGEVFAYDTVDGMVGENSGEIIDSANEAFLGKMR